MPRSPPLTVSGAERRELVRWTRRPGPSRRAKRARIVLAAAEGASNSTIAHELRVAPETVARWRERYRALGVDGLRREAPRGGDSTRVPHELVEQVLRATVRQRPADEGSWSTRTLARALRTNHMTVHRIWRTYGLTGPRGGFGSNPMTPSRLDLVGVYRTRAVSAVVFALDGRPSARPSTDGAPTTAPPEIGPTRASAKLLTALRSSRPVRDLRDDRRPAPSSLLVFLRSVEEATPPSARLDAIFDRSVTSLGHRVAAWLETHPRYRVFGANGEDEWMRSTETWLRRWERISLDPESFRGLGTFHRTAVEPTGSMGGRGIRTTWTSSEGARPGRRGDPRAGRGVGTAPAANPLSPAGPNTDK